MHGKRRKVSVRFVELPDTLPAGARRAKCSATSVTNDFLAVLDARNRRMAVLLNSGVTSPDRDLSDILGYNNHSAISKRLTHIQ